MLGRISVHSVNPYFTVGFMFVVFVVNISDLKIKINQFSRNYSEKNRFLLYVCTKITHSGNILQLLGL